MTEIIRKSLKPVGTRPGVMYGMCKVHTASVGNCPPVRPILSALNTPTYKLAKFLVPILKPLAANECTVKDSFHFAEEGLSKTEFKEPLGLWLLRICILFWMGHFINKSMV